MLYSSTALVLGNVMEVICGARPEISSCYSEQDLFLSCSVSTGFSDVFSPGECIIDGNISFAWKTRLNKQEFLNNRQVFLQLEDKLEQLFFKLPTMFRDNFLIKFFDECNDMCPELNFFHGYKSFMKTADHLLSKLIRIIFDFYLSMNFVEVIFIQNVIAAWLTYVDIKMLSHAHELAINARTEVSVKKICSDKFLSVRKKMHSVSDFAMFAMIQKLKLSPADFVEFLRMNVESIPDPYYKSNASQSISRVRLTVTMTDLLLETARTDEVALTLQPLLNKYVTITRILINSYECGPPKFNKKVTVKFLTDNLNKNSITSYIKRRAEEIYIRKSTKREVLSRSTQTNESSAQTMETGKHFSLINIIDYQKKIKNLSLTKINRRNDQYLKYHHSTKYRLVSPTNDDAVEQFEKSFVVFESDLPYSPYGNGIKFEYNVNLPDNDFLKPGKCGSFNIKNEKNEYLRHILEDNVLSSYIPPDRDVIWEDIDFPPMTSDTLPVFEESQWPLLTENFVCVRGAQVNLPNDDYKNSFNISKIKRDEIECFTKII